MRKEPRWIRIARSSFRGAYLPALIAVLLIAGFGVYAERQHKDLYVQSLRNSVLSEVSLIRARLEGNLSGNIQLVRGLVAVVATEPDMTQERFAQVAGNLIRSDSQLRSVAAAPDLVVRMIHPLEVNRAAIGLDYRSNAKQREAALKAIDAPDVVLAGPVNLLQGGVGFVGRFPVYLSPERTPESFWGLVAAVVDADKLYRDSGLTDQSLGIDLAIRGRDANGAEGENFFGPENVHNANPVLADVHLPWGSWRIAAVPKKGWEPAPSSTWTIRGLVALAAFVIAVPLIAAGKFADQRTQSIQKLRDREGELEHLSRRLELAVDVSKIGVWEYDMATGQAAWDERVYELYGVAPGTPLTHELWLNRVHPDDRERAESEFNLFAEGKDYYASEFRILQPDGTIRYNRARAARFGKGSAGLIIGAEWDVTADVLLNQDLERAKSEAEQGYRKLEAANLQIEHDARHDLLTGLPNRRYLDERLSELSQKPNNGVTLLHIDLDRFKQINDTLGHAAGDAMLVHAAGILRQNAESEFVARIGGDEFIVLCLGRNADSGEAAQLASRIICAMRQPVSYEGHECRFGVSVGIAQKADEGGLDPKRLLVNADIALYRAKSQGRNRYEFFSDDLQAEIVAAKRTADEILSGIERNEFVAYYQPQMDARTQRIVGVEALVRWHHPTRGVLGPNAFLAIAEDLNVMATLDRIVLEQSLRDLDIWQAAGIDIDRVSVNVSARRLRDEGLVESLRQMNIRPGSITFELVESIFLDDDDDIVECNVQRIKDFGIDVEIDDFGTGYASIVSLLKLKPRRLKIDRQLVMPIVAQPSQRQLVQSIIEIGHSLGIEVVAEGVETMEHATILRLLGVDLLQGYAFAGALSAEAIGVFAGRVPRRAAS